MKKYKKTFNPNRIKLGMSYSVQDISELFVVHKRTVLAWIKEGLPLLDQKKPFLINSEDLRAFIINRQDKRKTKCAKDEFYCFKCRKAKRPFDGDLEAELINPNKYILRGLCPDCTSIMNKIITSSLFEDLRETSVNITMKEQHLIQCSKPSVSTHLKEDKKL